MLILFKLTQLKSGLGRFFYAFGGFPAFINGEITPVLLRKKLSEISVALGK